MSRMDSFTFLPRSKSVLWVLCILVGCLAMHFLVEDYLLLNTFASLESASTNPLSYDEVTHQDDLAIPLLLPEHVAYNDVPPAHFLTVPFEKRTDSPILTPPKIA